jgi:transposase
VVKRSARAEKQPRQAPSLQGIERRLAQMQAHLLQNDIRIKGLERKVKDVTAERDDFKRRYFRSLDRIREQDKQIEALKLKLDSAEKQLASFRREKFGQSTETDAPKDPAPINSPAVGKRKRGQQPGSKGHGRTQRNNIDEEERVLDVKDSACASCHKPFKLLPETDDSTITEIEILLFQLKYRRCRYARQCNCVGAKIITAPAPPRLYPKTTIGNSLWVHLCVQKFLHGTPTNRTLKDLALRELGLAAGTVTGGFKIINSLLEPLYEAIKTFCQGEHYWNADETHWRVLDDKKKWWLWVIAGRKAIVYILDESRSRRVPEEFFAGSIGILMTDRYSAYKSLPASIKKAWCWVHVRRDFLKLFRGLSKFRKWAKKWLLDITKLFVLNHLRFKSWSENQFSPALDGATKAVQDHVEHIRNNWDTQLSGHLHPLQRTAVLSLKRHWAGLTVFLQDPRIPLDNNRAERLLRNCVINRKNSYGNAVEWAGHLSAKFFSVFQTWLTNGLDPQALLLDYFNECSLNPGKPPPSIDKFLPWKMDEQRTLEFRLPVSYKRPA